MTEQRDRFRAGEGDAWYRRNATAAPSVALELIAAHLGQATRILEVGCADGRNLAALATRHAASYVGLDPSEAAIAEGRLRWPAIELHVGTAEALPFDDAHFDVVILGFFLYLCDRQLLPRIVAEADRVLVDGGALAIVDFDPPSPRRRDYHHAEGISSYKMDYARLFLAYPSYVLVEKAPFHHGGAGWAPDEDERLAVNVLRKTLGGGYADGGRELSR